MELMLNISALRLTVVCDMSSFRQMPRLKLLRGDMVLFDFCSGNLGAIKEAFTKYVTEYAARKDFIKNGEKKASNPKTDGHSAEVFENMVTSIRGLRADYINTSATYFGPKSEILLHEALALLEQAQCKARMAVILSTEERKALGL